MKVVALISGGKDSCFNMMHCVAEGHEIVALANLKPKEKDELDSYMYQTVGHHAIDLYAEAMGLPLYRHIIKGGSIQQGTDYKITAEDEVEDLFTFLQNIMKEISFEAVSVGAILSDYQRVRVENVCQRLGLTSLAYLWRRDQKELLKEMIDCGVKAILIKVAALGLMPEKHLGKSLAEMESHMMNMITLPLIHNEQELKLICLQSEKYGLNPCGEGGEYETFTLDCPLFNKEIVIDEKEVVMHSDDAFAPVAYINFKKMHLQEKNIIDAEMWSDRVKHLTLKRSCEILQELDINTQEESPKIEGTSFVKCPVNKVNYSQHFSSSYKGGKWYSISGILAWEDTRSTIEEQTRFAMEKLNDVMKEQSLTTSDLVAVHLYVSDLNDFTEINRTYKTYFGLNPPVRICVEASLPVGVILQLDCLGCHTSDQIHRHTMHVQGLSHWAPANIGPYSQSVQIDGVIYVAGQIALVPGSMKVMEGGIIPQTVLSLRHVERVLKAVSSKSNWNCVRLTICYLTDPGDIDATRRLWQQSVDKEKDEIDQSNSLLQCVVVPRLPREALVEWQVYATNHTDYVIEENSHTVNLNDFKANCTCQLVRNEENSRLCSLVCKVESQKQQFSCDSTEKAQCLLETTLHCIHQTLCKLYSSDSVTEDLKTFRIFYCLQYFKSDHIFSEYTNIYHKVFGKNAGLVPPAFVPVSWLENEQHVLSVCH